MITTAMTQALKMTLHAQCRVNPAMEYLTKLITRLSHEIRTWDEPILQMFQPDVVRFLYKLRRPMMVISVNTVPFLRDWLENHQPAILDKNFWQKRKNSKTIYNSPLPHYQCWHVDFKLLDWQQHWYRGVGAKLRKN